MRDTISQAQASQAQIAINEELLEEENSVGRSLMQMQVLQDRRIYHFPQSH
jgi:hypothetical protein